MGIFCIGLAGLPFDNRPMVADDNDILVHDGSTWLFLINQHLFPLMHRCLINRHTGRVTKRRGWLLSVAAYCNVAVFVG